VIVGGGGVVELEVAVVVVVLRYCILREV
jgi:hypothetical protein